MADNIYLLETRLSKAQQAALVAVRDVARAKGLTVFLVGGAVRDLIGGAAVRDLDVVVQGSVLKLRKDMEKAGGTVIGETEAGQAIFLRFPGGVRMEIGSTLTVTYPKPGKAVAKPATILEDLRRRDFTANAMALSLNEGSYGLLMDPLNGVADIENRELRLVSNYGFIEDPARMIRAARFMARLGWGMDEKTQGRYETGKAEGYISAMDEFHRGYETEEIFHEEDPLRVMRRMEEEGWTQHLAPALLTAKANVAELERLRESQAQLQMQGVVADASAANFPLLTAKMSAKDVEALKKSFPRQGFVSEIDGLEARGKEFAAQLGAKGAAAASQAFKLITGAEAETVLWTAYTTKSPALQAKFKSFYTDWPQARQRIPYLQMQEMRITPDLPDYEILVDRLFFELMDGRLGTVEEMKAFLEPYSPPAPPPPVSLRRPRAAKKDAKPAKSRKKVADAPVGDGSGTGEESPLQTEAAITKPRADAAVAAKPAKAAAPVTAKVAAPEAAAAVATPAVQARGSGDGAARPKTPVKGKTALVPAKPAVAAKGSGHKPAPVAAKKKAPSVPAKSSKQQVPAKKTPAKVVVPAKKAAAKKLPAKAVSKGARKTAAKPAAGKAAARQGGSAKGKPVAKQASKKVAAKGGGSKAAARKKTPVKKRR